MISKQIIITYELLNREILFLEEMAGLFRSKGYKVFILHQQLAFRLLKHFKPSFIIFKSADKGRVPWYRRAYEFGHKIICIDSEGLFIDPWEYVNIRVNSINLDLMFAYFTCGDHQKDLLVKAYPDSSKKIFSAGTSSLKRIQTLKTNFVSKKPKFEVGILTGFGGIHNNSNSTYLNLVKSMIKTELYEKFRLNYKNYLSVVQNAYDKFQELVILIASKYPEYKLNIRVHSSESSTSWKALSSKNKNIFISKESNIVEYLQNCKHVISWKSTVTIEALALNKPIISFTPEIIDPLNIVYPNNEPQNISKNFKDFDELLLYLKKEKTELTRPEEKIANSFANSISKGFTSPKWNPSLEILKILNKEKFVKSKSLSLKSEILYDISLSLRNFFKHIIFVLFNFKNYYPYGKLKIGSRKNFASIIDKCSNSKNNYFYYLIALVFRIIILKPEKD